MTARLTPTITFAWALVVLCGISAISYFTVREFANRARWVEHTQEVLREVEALLSDLKDVETGVRGYVIAGERSFLAPYQEAAARVSERLRRLRDLTRDNPAQQAQVMRLQALAEKRLQQAEGFRDLVRDRPPRMSDPARQSIVAGKETMDAIRTATAAMRAGEESLLSQRAQSSLGMSAVAELVILIGTAVSMAMLVGVFIMLRRQIENRARAERLAQAAAAEAENLYDKAPCGYHSVDAQGYFVRINDTELNWLGYSREEVIGRLRFVDVVAPECIATVRDNFPNLLRGQPTADLEYTLVRKDGSRFPVMVNALPILDASGTFVMSRTTMFDITALKKIEQQHRQANDFLDAVVENIPSMLFVKDADTLRFARINRAEEELLGMPREKLIGRSDHELFPAGQADFFVAKDREVLAANGVVMIEEENLTTPRDTLVLRTRKIALRDASGKPRYLLGISDDITEQKRAQQAIQDLNEHLKVRAEQLEAANKELESFSYSVSHDLRAPLRAIDGFSRIFEEDYGAQFDEEGRRLLRVIRESSQRMGVLIDDLLAFSRLGRQVLARQPVDMKALAGAALQEVRAAAPGDRAEVVIGDLPPAQVDPTLLRQVWVNLLSNAVKYSSVRENPRIEVGSLRPARPDDAAVYYVRDNGVGFDMRYYDKLFGVFQRLHRAEDFAGTGVGLAIVQRVVTRHGGRAWAEAEVDKGASFFFSIPEGAQG
ncbi:MAG TPA: CHASE3 domain-containing protein [Burkholderiales bacterium]|nr:CHASE3 domain-containing protein [Burkholderiales bacterium]